MTTQVINGVAVEVTGTGEPCLCIHGLGGSTNTWTTVLPGFRNFQTICIDLPGSARSELASEPLSIDLFVKTVGNVLDALGIDSLHIAAHSMGTIVAAHFAAQHPERVKGLAMFGPLLAPPDKARAGIRDRATLARRGIEGMQEIADAIVKGATSPESKEGHPAVLALVRESVMRQSPEGYAQSCEALAQAEAAEVERITAPVLLVTGDQDGVAPPAAVRDFGERLQRQHTVVLDGCGHWHTFEKPEACITELEKFYS